MATKPRNLFKSDLFWIITLFITAGVFRLFYLGNIEFKSDEANSFYLVFNLIKNHHFFLTGIMSSIGFYNFPLFTYFLALISGFYLDPQFLSLGIAFLNVLVIIFFYFLAKRFYSSFVAYSASLLLALDPWAILFSRKIWQQDLLLVFSMPLLYFLHRLLYLKDKKSIFWLFLFGTLLMQVHGSGTFFVAITIVCVIYKRIKIDPRSAIKGTLVGLIPAVPYFYYQFFSGVFCRDCVTFLSRSKIRDYGDFSHFIKPFQLFTTFSFDFELGKDFNKFLQSSFILNIMEILGIIVICLILLGIWVILKRKKEYLLLLFYFFLLPALYFTTGVYSLIHYYAILLPIVALIIAVGLEYLFTYKNLRNISLVVLGITLLGYSIFEIIFNSFLSSERFIHGDYGPIFEEGNRLIEKPLENYQLTANYDNLKAYARRYMYEKNFHEHLGDFFLQNREMQNALYEYSLEIKLNQKNTEAAKKIQYIREQLDNQAL